jgi:hypothetical protein
MKKVNLGTGLLVAMANFLDTVTTKQKKQNVIDALEKLKKYKIVESYKVVDPGMYEIIYTDMGKDFSNHAESLGLQYKFYHSSGYNSKKRTI